MFLKSLLSTAMFCTLVLIISVLNVAKASEQVIVDITRDEGNAVHKLVISDNEGREIQTIYKDVYIKGVRNKRVALNPAELMNGGIVLDQRGKYVVLKLTSSDFNLEQGGIITADTLYNGATGERRSYEIQIVKGQAGWELLRKNKVIKNILINTHKIMFIGPVGIKNLVMK